MRLLLLLMRLMVLLLLLLEELLMLFTYEFSLEEERRAGALRGQMEHWRSLVSSVPTVRWRRRKNVFVRLQEVGSFPIRSRFCGGRN